MILREPIISLLQDASLDELLESSSDPYIDDLLKSLGVRERCPDDSSFFLQAGAPGAAGRVRQKATQPPVPTSADAVPCSSSKILIFSNIVTGVYKHKHCSDESRI